MTITVDTVRRLALDLPSTTEKPCFGTPAWYVKGKLFDASANGHIGVVNAFPWLIEKPAPLP